MRSCGRVSATVASASARDSTAWTRCRGANFFSAELIAAVSASYSSTRRTLGAFPAGDWWEAGTGEASEWAENRRSDRHVKAKQRKLRASACGARALFEAQGFYRVERRRPVGRVKAEANPDGRANHQPGDGPPKGEYQVGLEP